MTVRLALALVLAALSIASACRSTETSDEPERSSACRPAQVVAIGDPVAGRYKETQGKKLYTAVAPYVQEYAETNRIDLERAKLALFPEGVPKPSDPTNARVYLSSYGHVNRINGAWTYIQSDTIVVHQLLRVRVGTSEPRLLVLHSHSTPDRLILDQFDAEWHLALLNERPELVVERAFATHIEHREEGLWDTIYTDLALEDGRPIVKIMYAHSGGGGGRNQEFTFEFAAGDEKPCLEVIQAAQTLDEYLEGE